MTDDRPTDPTCFPPPSASNMVVRQRLLDRLTLGSRLPVTLVIAAPGSGKTQLLANWFASAEYPGPKAWVTLDGQHGGPAAFWTTVTTALAGIGVLPANAINPRETGVAELLGLGASLAAQPAPIVLILDQAECLALRALADDLDRVLTHSAGKLRIVIGSRVNPALPHHRYRLRARVRQSGAPLRP